MTTYWFKPKRYGYGATPVTWQGWSATLAAVVAIAIAATVLVPRGVHNPAAWIAFAAVEAAIVAVLWIIARRKTDGEWRWRWGGQ